MWETKRNKSCKSTEWKGRKKWINRHGTGKREKGKSFPKGRQRSGGGERERRKKERNKK